MTDILIVEDNAELAGLLRDFLRAENYTAHIAKSGEEALAFFEAYGARLVALDVMLPGMDGFAVCQRIRENSDAPILFLTAKTEKEDQLTGLSLGADDYIEKPYDIDIMLAKIKGIFKRRYAMDEIVDGSLRLDRVNKEAFFGQKRIDMTAKEFELLALLMENKGRTMDKESLFRRVWGSDSFSEPQTLTVHIKRLRQKIEDDPKNPKKILTAWGVGYRYL